MSPVKCYSVRRLCPFQGSAQFLEIDDGRAISVDGKNWEIQVRTERPGGLWANMPHFQREFFRFGVWSPEEGLGRVPLNPLMNSGQMLHASEALLSALPVYTRRLPFPFRDSMELWLLDRDDETPLALVASAAVAAGGLPPRGDTPRWLATLPADHSFRAVIRGPGVSDRPRLAADTLEKQVRDAAGAPPYAGWFRRRTDGSARSVEPDTGKLGHRRPASDFPALLLRSRWDSPEREKLVDRFFDWQAPRLLTLDGLPEDLRDRLEHRAAEKAAEMDKFWRLYPVVLNPDLLRKARVEARLRSANDKQDTAQ